MLSHHANMLANSIVIFKIFINQVIYSKIKLLTKRSHHLTHFQGVSHSFFLSTPREKTMAVTSTKKITFPQTQIPSSTTLLPIAYTQCAPLTPIQKDFLFPNTYSLHTSLLLSPPPPHPTPSLQSTL